MPKRTLSIKGEVKSVIERLFETIDVDKNLEISWEEFLAFQAKAKMSLEASWPFDVSEIRQEFSDIDTDGSGTISKSEFVDVFSNVYDVSAISQLEEMLDVIIDKTNAKEEVIVNESEQEKFVREMMEDFDRSDLDGNGSMDFSEYIRQVWSDETQEKSATLQQLRRQFKAFDLNQDGKISRQEFQIMAENCYFAMKSQ